MVITSVDPGASSSPLSVSPANQSLNQVVDNWSTAGGLYGFGKPAMRYAANWMSGLPPRIESMCTPPLSTTPLKRPGRAAFSASLTLLDELKLFDGAPISRIGM